MSLKIFIRKTHKWIGLLIGIQIFFWVTGGLIMSWFPIEEVHGDHLHTTIDPVVIDPDKLYPVSELIKTHGLNTVLSQISVYDSISTF